MQDSIVQSINVSPKRLLKLLLGIDIGLIIANLIGYAGIYLSDSNLAPLAQRFILRSESSLPTWYSSIQLLVCAVLLFLIGLESRQLEQGKHRQWWGLSALFLYISMDEVATFRESIARLTHVETSGPFYYSWVIVAIPAVLVLAFLYARFILQLPKPIRFLFLLAGGLFIAGGLGFEMVAASIHSSAGVPSMAEAPIRARALHAMAGTVEESLEIIGVTVFLYALLVYIRLQHTVTSKTNLL